MFKKLYKNEYDLSIRLFDCPFSNLEKYIPIAITFIHASGDNYCIFGTKMKHVAITVHLQGYSNEFRSIEVLKEKYLQCFVLLFIYF